MPTPGQMMQTAASFRLSVVRGPDLGAWFVVDGSAPGAEFIGTSLSCRLRLSDRTVLRRHARVDVEGVSTSSERLIWHSQASSSA